MKPAWVLTAIGIGAFLGVVVVCGGLGTAFLLVMNAHMGNMGQQWGGLSGGSVSDLDYTLTGPDEIQLGQPAVFVAEVTNTATVTRQLYSLDLFTELVDQGPFDADPVPKHINHQRNNQYAELVYERDLGPGETVKVEMTLNPTLAGEYDVKIDAYDAGFNFVERFHTLTVREADND